MPHTHTHTLYMFLKSYDSTDSHLDYRHVLAEGGSGDDDVEEELVKDLPSLSLVRSRESWILFFDFYDSSNNIYIFIHTQERATDGREDLDRHRHRQIMALKRVNKELQDISKYITRMRGAVVCVCMYV